MQDISLDSTYNRRSASSWTLPLLENLPYIPIPGSYNNSYSNTYWSLLLICIKYTGIKSVFLDHNFLIAKFNTHSLIFVLWEDFCSILHHYSLHPFLNSVLFSLICSPSISPFHVSFSSLSLYVKVSSSGYTFQCSSLLWSLALYCVHRLSLKHFIPI